MSIQVVYQFSQKEQAEIRKYLDTTQSLLVNDVSKYARGRKRYWFNYEPRLTSGGKEYSKANSLPKLIDFSKPTYEFAVRSLEIPDLAFEFGLVAYGNVGIEKHRDDTYAAYPAVTVNISKEPTLWGYTKDYQQFKYGKRDENAQEVIYEIPPGAVVLFNCKNPHRVVRCDAERYSINLWSVSAKAKPFFDKFKSAL